MNVKTIERAIGIINRCQRAQEWLHNYGEKLTGKTDYVEGSVKITIFSGNLESDVGYIEAVGMMEGYAKISFPKLVETCLENCQNTIVVYRDQIREELDKMTNPLKDEISSLARSAHNASRRSVQYANWAREAELQGRREQARRWRDEADRKRGDAGWYLQLAFERKDIP